MDWSRYHTFLVLMLVITGSINTLCTKWADTVIVKGSDGNDRRFDHPFLQVLSLYMEFLVVNLIDKYNILMMKQFLQACAMFLGEMLCLLTFKILWRVNQAGAPNALTEGNQNFNPFILMPAAMFDLVSYLLSIYLLFGYKWPHIILPILTKFLNLISN